MDSDAELKKLVEQTHALARDNHAMLRAIRRHMWFNFWSRIIIWLIILFGPVIFYYYYLKPLVHQFEVNAPGGAMNISNGFLGLPTFADLQKLINSYKSGH